MIDLHFHSRRRLPRGDAICTRPCCQECQLIKAPYSSRNLYSSLEPHLVFAR
jgi:hypothetical protein